MQTEAHLINAFINNRVELHTYLPCLCPKDFVVDRDQVLPRNDASLSGSTEDLADLPHLDEPNVLESLRLRCQTKKIYTYTGFTLLALNPWIEIPGIIHTYIHIHALLVRKKICLTQVATRVCYSTDFPTAAELYSSNAMLTYRFGGKDSLQDGHHGGSSLRKASPHVYDVARRTFYSMLSTQKVSKLANKNNKSDLEWRSEGSSLACMYACAVCMYMHVCK
jgi:myosin heavy subunit